MSSSLLTKALRGVGRKAALVGWPAPGWPPATGYIGKTAGVTVTNDSVLGTAAAWASVTLIARSIARLPLFTYQFREDGGKDKDRGHSMYPLLHDQPNPFMTKWGWLAAAFGHEETWGNSYAEIERNGFDQIIGLHPRRPDLWHLEWKAGKKVFYYRQPTGREIELEEARVFHVPAFSPDGLLGYPPISLHRSSFALSQASVEYGTRVFQNDARPSVVLQYPKTFNDTQVARLEDSYLGNHSGPSNAGKTALLEEGVTLKEFGFPPKDAQYLELRQFQRDETDDIFGIPIGFRRSADEGMAIKFVVYTLGPRLVMFEQEIKRQLLPEPDVFAEFAVEGLLRGNWAARAGFYASGRTNGWLNVNEIRAMENRNPIGPDGEEFQSPLNMQPLGGSEGSEDRNPSPTTGNPDSPGAARPIDDTEPIEATPPSGNGRAYSEVI